MHDESAQGNEFFKCDFCRQAWAEDRPMVEGHRGSLVCVNCLTLAYTEVFVNDGGSRPPEGQTCRMCLERRDQAHWVSPLFPDACICKRCINQAAVTLERDPDHAWKRPASA